MAMTYRSHTSTASRLPPPKAPEVVILNTYSTPDLSQLNPNSTPDLSQLNLNSTPDLSQLNPNSTPDLSQLNPNSTPDLTQLNPTSTPDLSQLNRDVSQELCNSYTELNNPFTQRQRFQEQAKQATQGDDEAQVSHTETHNICTCVGYFWVLALRHPSEV